jgi:lysozyme
MSTPDDKKKMIAGLSALGVSAAAIISGVFLVAPSEGYHTTTYLDPVAIITSCYGHTGNDLEKGQVFTDEECLDQFAKDLQEADEAVDDTIHVPLTLWQRAALISFTYNAGETNLKTSTMAKEFNQQEYDKGCDQLLSWVYAKKKRLKGLEERRKLERSMCLGQMELPNVNNN